MKQLQLAIVDGNIYKYISITLTISNNIYMAFNMKYGIRSRNGIRIADPIGVLNNELAWSGSKTCLRFGANERVMRDRLQL